MAPVTHLVLFAFKPEASAEDCKKICDQMLDLKDKCLHPTSQKPYIKSAVGGVENSSVNLHQGITHAFVVEFETMEDRDYYLTKDPAHLGFVQGTLKLVAKIQVVDFTPGVF